MKVNYRSESLAIVSDLRSPFIVSETHPEWRSQFIHSINNPKVHSLLEKKLERFGRYVVCYTKITPSKEKILELVGYENATVCVISSVGEHLMTAWMIVHNICHTYMSENMRYKRQIKAALGLHGDHYQIAPYQQELVDCASARKMAIPNINELIYELFTTWVWHGETKTKHEALKACCDRIFPELVDKYHLSMFWHKYRCPMEIESDTKELGDLIREISDIEVPLKPGMPGYTSKILRVHKAEKI